MDALSSAIEVTDSAFKTADAVIDGIELCEAADPIFAVLGFVTSFVKLFTPSETDILLQEL